jgi:ubiquinone/menaquinone biosynthesis C-methylase UbiE
MISSALSRTGSSYTAIVDVGCGWGFSFKLLDERFKPQHLVGIDVDSRMLAAARAEAERHGLSVEFQKTTGSRLMIPDQSMDMVFCLQTFHRIIDQEKALRGFHRVLKPEGLLLFAESTTKFINS